MIRNVLTHTGGIAVYGIVSVCLFFAVFLAAVAWTLVQRTSHVRRMGALPLDDGETRPFAPSASKNHEPGS
ncbi:MAG: hypothetical protein LW626_05610 [Verrucomicrobium sp.]|jgi:hypothetical protein|nr:hypothetical protein [Verrucomicrobium sp.]MCE2826551.1 hypothetical protein [Verrucomicrobium sp.]